MREPWENFAFTWWPSSAIADPGLPAFPPEPNPESWRGPWPSGMAPTWPISQEKITSDPAGGGLLASLNAGGSGGLFGGLTPPQAQLKSARYQGIPPAPKIGASGSVLGPYLWPTSGTTESDTVAPLITRPMHPHPNLPNRSPASRSQTNPEFAQRNNSGSEVPDTPEVLSDATPYNSWIPGADYADEHHIFPQAHYKRLSRETKKVFKDSTIGELLLRLDGRRHENDAFHRLYNAATGQLMADFMAQNNIAEPEKMTPDHARAVLKAIAESEDPRIKYYLEFIRRLRMFYRLRTGRGSE
jgi:hypothetical protein